MMGSLFFWMGLVGLIAGAATLAWAAAKHLGARGVESWPRVPAIVRHAHVVQHADGFEPRITYEYEVDGRHLVGHAIDDGGTIHAPRGWADSLVLRYAPDTVAELHVDPDDPRHAVLETKSRAAPAALTGSLLALASVAVLFAALLISR